MDLVDLTVPLYAGMPGQPGDPPVAIVPARSHDGDGYQVTQLCLGSHSGTHLDAPRHFFPDGATLDQYPVDRLLRPGVIVDCRPAPRPAGGSRGDLSVGRGADAVPGRFVATVINAALLAERLRFSPVPPAGFLLLWTEGTLLAAETGRLLLETGAGLVGTDAPSLDAEPYPVHRLLLGHGVLLAENLHGLDRLGAGPVTCAFLPLAVVGTDGAPVRAVAWR